MKVGVLKLPQKSKSKLLVTTWPIKLCLVTSPSFPPGPQDQRHKECNVHCSLGISLLGPIHHVVKKSKQDEGSHMWRETKPWLSSQMKASTYLAAM